MSLYKTRQKYTCELRCFVIKNQKIKVTNFQNSGLSDTFPKISRSTHFASKERASMQEISIPEVNADVHAPSRTITQRIQSPSGCAWNVLSLRKTLGGSHPTKRNTGGSHCRCPDKRVRCRESLFGDSRPTTMDDTNTCLYPSVSFLG